MTKKVKQSYASKLPPAPVKKAFLNTTLSKELQLLGYVLCFITLHNITLHNGHLHSIHKELVAFSVLVLSYRPALAVLQQNTVINRMLTELLKCSVHLLFWGTTMYVSPVLLSSLLTPSGLSFIPGMVVTLLCAEKPPNSLPMPPGKSSTPDEIRGYANTLIADLKVRVQYVGVNIVCYSYVACYLPFTFAQGNTVVRQMTCIRTQMITAILHIMVLLITQVLPVDYIVRLSTAANLLGRWQSAVVTEPIDSLHEWKEGVQWDIECIVRCDDKTYLATSPTVTAQPGSLPHSLLHVLFSQSFRLLKILTLIEVFQVVVLFYQTVSLKYFQQFLPSSLLLLLHLHTIMSVVNDAKLMNCNDAKLVNTPKEL